MRVAIYGYGNLGKGVEAAIGQNPDMELVGVFSRRGSAVKTLSGAPSFSADEILNFKGVIDVVIICGGSATDLPVMTPMLAAHFNVVDSFDTHAKIPEHFASVDAAATEGEHTALISVGWDPGLFSIARLYAASALPSGKDYTFWGKGISQGHSDAIRRIAGVVDARQYTVPIESAYNSVLSGDCPDLTAGQRHRRECYVVCEDGADKDRIEREIKTMPNYFADYETEVDFISMDELVREHSGMPHGGSVIRCGKTGMNEEHSHTVEFSLKLDSNPEFTGSVLVAYARAIKRIYDRGCFGCKTPFDVAPGDLSILSPEELRAKML